MATTKKQKRDVEIRTRDEPAPAADEDRTERKTIPVDPSWLEEVRVEVIAPAALPRAEPASPRAPRSTRRPPRR